MTIEELIGERVRQARQAADMSQQQLADALGELLGRTWYAQQVSALEKGRRAITAAELAALVHLLGTSVQALTMPLSGHETVEVAGVAIPWTAVASTRAAALDDVHGQISVALSLMQQGLEVMNNNAEAAGNVLQHALSSLVRAIGGQAPADTSTQQEDVLRAIFGEADPAALERETDA